MLREVDDEVEVQIRGLMLDPVTNMPIVILRELDTEVVLPIWVGVFEAQAISAELEKATAPRPMTHDLLRTMARGLGAKVTRVVVSDLREDTFYATIWMEQAGETVALDARPSDAFALALRWDCPIFVARKVLKTTRQAASEAGVQASSEELRQWLENLNEDETGGYKM